MQGVRAGVVERSADTTIPILKTIFSPFSKKLQAKKDSATQGVQKDLAHMDSPEPKSGKPRTEIHLVLHGSNPSQKSDSVSNPAPNAIAMDHGVCRMVLMRPLWVYDTVKLPIASGALRQAPIEKIPFLQVHGNILYDVNYYSRIDTHYDETNVYQHTVQTYLDVLIKGQYPFRIYITNHFSNSPLFRNFNDFNFTYTNTTFNQGIKNQLVKQYMDSIAA